MANGNEYLETRVMTAAPQELHLMVVDGAIRFATQAADALDGHDHETAHLALNRSREFVTELIGGLDPDREDDVIQRLRALFGHVYRELIDGEHERDASKLRHAIELLDIHRQGWLEIIERLKLDRAEVVQSTEGNSWSS